MWPELLCAGISISKLLYPLFQWMAPSTTSPLNQRPRCTAAFLCPISDTSFKSVHLTTEELSNPSSLASWIRTLRVTPHRSSSPGGLFTVRRAATGIQEMLSEVSEWVSGLPYCPWTHSHKPSPTQHATIFHVPTAFMALISQKCYTTAFIIQTLRKVCYFYAYQRHESLWLLKIT